MLIPKIFSDNFFRYFVANRADQVTVIPKFSTPQFFLHLWEFSKRELCRHTLDYLHYPRWNIYRRHSFTVPLRSSSRVPVIEKFYAMLIREK